MRILFCQLKSYGDIIRTFKAIESVKKFYPDSFLAATCLDGMESVMKLCECLDIVIPQRKLLCGDNLRVLDCSVLEESVLISRNLNFDYYIDFNGVFQSALFGSLSNIKKRFGPNKPSGKDGAYLFYTDLINIDWKEVNRMQRHFNLCKEIFKDLEIESNTKINKNGSILITPGTSEIGIYKRWTTEGYTYLIENILKNTEEVVEILIHKDELDIGKDIFSNINNERCSLIEVDNFKDAFKIIEQCKCVISTDSAYAHIATVKDIPTFMILGPTSIKENAPWDKLISSYSINKQPCSPCNLWARRCKYNNICMKNLDKVKVYNGFIQFYNRIKRGEL